MELRRGDKVLIKRHPDFPTLEAWVEDIQVTLDGDKLGCQVLLEIGTDDPVLVGVFLLALWVEWAK